MTNKFLFKGEDFFIRLLVLGLSLLVMHNLIAANESEIKFDELEIVKKISINIWGFQKVLKVPYYKKYFYDNNKDYLIGYRSEFHNGSENGCLLVLGEIKNKKFYPKLVIEELFIGAGNYYYLRTIDGITKNSVNVSLFKTERTKKKKLAKIIYIYNGSRYIIKDIKFYDKISKEAAESYSDAFYTDNKDIFTGNKPYF